MKMRRIDHVVLPVADLNVARRFYHEVFDMPVLDQQSTDDVVTLRCGHQLIRLEKVDRDSDLVATKLVPGTADLCLVAGDDMDAIVHHLRSRRQKRCRRTDDVRLPTRPRPKLDRDRRL